MRRHAWLIAAALLVGLWVWLQPPANMELPLPAGTNRGAIDPGIGRPDTAPARTHREPRYPGFLPGEAHPVLDAIARDGPYRYRQDGGTFHNRERRLPERPRGHYREFTVDTPGSRDRGARRIVTGGDPPREYWYSDDHYGSFVRFQIDGGTR